MAKSSVFPTGITIRVLEEFHCPLFGKDVISLFIVSLSNEFYKKSFLMNFIKNLYISHIIFMCNVSKYLQLCRITSGTPNVFHLPASLIYLHNL